MARHVPTGDVDWRTARLGPPEPCVACRQPAIMRHPVTGRPHHKTCDPIPTNGA